MPFEKRPRPLTDSQIKIAAKKLKTGREHIPLTSLVLGNVAMIRHQSEFFTYLEFLSLEPNETNVQSFSYLLGVGLSDGYAAGANRVVIAVDSEFEALAKERGLKNVRTLGFRFV